MNDYQLEKGDVKQLFLSVMNGGKRDGITDQVFVKFETECKRIHTFISSLNPKLLKDFAKENKKFSSLCNIENEISLTSV